MIFLDKNLHELGSKDIDIDVEIGNSEAASNDFEFDCDGECPTGMAGFYIPGTEIGGLIEYTKSKTDQSYSTLKGFTWRGLISKNVILPPAGTNYKVVSGEANQIIASMLFGVLGDFFTISTADSGLTISSYQFPLYINLLDGLEGMLEKYGYRLKITASKVASNQPIVILIEAVQAQLIQGTFNEDNGIPMTFIVDFMGINHLICGGSGELQNRMIRHLYIDDQGQISNTQYYFGFDERTEFYNFPNAESEVDLIDNGRKRLKEIASHKTLKMKAPDDYELEVGDVVQGVFPDGTIIRKPIVLKIYKIENGLLTTDYKIKGEE